MSRYKTKAEERADYLGYQRGYHAGVKKSVKHGRWEQDGTGLYARCTVCKERTYLGGRQKYCPNCGAKMEVS